MENEEIQQNIDFYLDTFEAMKERVGSDEVAATLVEQIGKDARVRAMANQESSKSEAGEKTVIHGDEPATESQLGFLKRLGVRTKPRNRLHASELIDDAKGR